MPSDNLPATERLLRTAAARLGCAIMLAVAAICGAEHALGQHTPEGAKLQEFEEQLHALTNACLALDADPKLVGRDGEALVADVAVFEKACQWMLRHDEFLKPDYAAQLENVLKLGLARAAQVRDTHAGSWSVANATHIRGYISQVDGSVQPYALTLPPAVNPRDGKRWPLHVVLHGRANDMNEVNFIHRHEGRKSGIQQEWIQLDVYGRGSNAYRWAGETDVMEAIADVKRRFRIDENRVTLHGFSMGGAGAWHLGMHYPHLWSSVGPGAGFVDFYKYQNQPQRLPLWQHQTLGIYDAVDYALNAFNVPVCTYGGEIDPQLLAGTTMQQAAAEDGVEIKLIVGPGMGHKFDPASLKEFMAFHIDNSAIGRPGLFNRRDIRFETRTLRYNQCEWLTIEEVENVYEPSRVEAGIDEDGNVDMITHNVAALSVARETAGDATIDGITLPCRSAAEGLLPNVYYQKSTDGWDVLDYPASREFSGNPGINKRHGLQGPIDDAFQSSFVCVRGTGTPDNASLNKWAQWTLQRFASEFDFWLRGEVKVVRDDEVDDEIISRSNLILFGDPGSNLLIDRVINDLPIQWTATEIRVGDQTWDTANHGISLIYPNPLNPRRYVVINSGHTFHSDDFKASNAWLFPRLGDIAVQKLTPNDQGGYSEEIVWAANFNSNWQLAPVANAAPE